MKVDKFIFPADFIILDYKVDQDVPIILGRSFLATGHTLIDVQKSELTMRVQDDQVTFNVLKAMKFPIEVEECSAISFLHSMVAKKLETSCQDELLDFPFTMDSAEAEQEALKHLAWLDSNTAMQGSSRKFKSLDLINRGQKPTRPSSEEPPILELKPLPAHLKYAYLGESSTLPVIISAELTIEQGDRLITTLREF